MKQALTSEEMENMAIEAACLLDALSNPKRLLIMCNLIEGEASVNDLSEKVGLNQSALSQHLGKLRNLKFVKTRRDAQQIFYSIADDNVYEIIAVLKKLYCD